MATTKPRITISLDPNVYATLRRMSELGGQPMAGIVSELLESVHEPLMRTVAFLEAASDAPKQIRDGLRRSFETVERDLYGAAGHTIAQMDFLTEQLRAGGATPCAATEPATARARGGVPMASDSQVNPHNVIRGSGLAKANKIKHLGKGSKGVKK